MDAWVSAGRASSRSPETPQRCSLVTRGCRRHFVACRRDVERGRPGIVRTAGDRSRHRVDEHDLGPGGADKETAIRGNADVGQIGRGRKIQGLLTAGDVPVGNPPRHLVGHDRLFGTRHLGETHDAEPLGMKGKHGTVASVQDLQALPARLGVHEKAPHRGEAEKQRFFLQGKTVDLPLLLPVPYGKEVRARAVGDHDSKLRLRRIHGQQPRFQLRDLELAHEDAQRRVPEPDGSIVTRAHQQVALVIEGKTEHCTRMPRVHEASCTGLRVAGGKARHAETTMRHVPSRRPTTCFTPRPLPPFAGKPRAAGRTP